MTKAVTRDQTDRWPLGTRVSWESHGARRQTTKTGRIFAVIKPGQTPADPMTPIAEVFPGHRLMFDGPRNATRPGVSYLVEVPHPGKGKPRLYWPRVEGLSEAEE